MTGGPGPRARTAAAMDIAVLIVDDFPLVRQGIASVLRIDPAIRVVGEAANASEALERVRALSPDVVLLDLRLGDDDGIELIKRLVAEADGVAVLVITAIEKIDTMRDAAAAGARGYVTKRASPRDLRDAIVTVFGGGAVFDQSTTEDLLRDFPQIAPYRARDGPPAAHVPGATGARAGRPGTHRQGDGRAALALGPHRAEPSQRDSAQDRHPPPR